MKGRSIFKGIETKNYSTKKFINNHINKKTFPIVNAIYSNLLNCINDLDINYNGNFGYIVIDNIEYLYTYNNDRIINTFLFEPNIIKKHQYEDILKNNCLRDINKKDKSDKSGNSFKSDINNYKEKKSDQNTYRRNKKGSYYSCPKIGNNDNNGQDEYELTFFKGFEFENNSTYLFKSLFQLKDLPTYFFPLEKKYKSNIMGSDVVNFSDYNKNLFSAFLETDGAYINDKNEKLLAKLKNNYHPFQIQNTFEVYKINEKYDLKLIKEELEIDPYTIIINESKLSIPKNINDFSIDKNYDKNALEKTLIFTLNKLILKKHYYYELVKNEFFKNCEEIKNYKFLFCLIYNNKYNN